RRVIIAITLVEDLPVVVLTVFLPTLMNPRTSSLATLGVALFKATIILVPVVFISTKLVPRLMAKAAGPNQELLLLVALALGFATAALTQATMLPRSAKPKTNETKNVARMPNSSRIRSWSPFPVTAPIRATIP